MSGPRCRTDHGLSEGRRGGFDPRVGLCLGYSTVPHDRDVQVFHHRAATYEDGWRGKMHADIAGRAAELVSSLDEVPRRVLDVGCGTGLLLRMLAERLPGAEKLVGIDAAAGMISVASSKETEPRIGLSTGVAEDLPFPDSTFDLVVSTTSFDHWQDQGAGLGECARVLAPSGHLILTDLFSRWLAPTMIGGHRGHARTRHRAALLLRSAGFSTVTWYRGYALIIGTVMASK